MATLRYADVSQHSDDMNFTEEAEGIVEYLPALAILPLADKWYGVEKKKNCPNNVLWKAISGVNPKGYLVKYAAFHPGFFYYK